MKKWLKIIIVICVIVLILIGGFYLYKTFNKAKDTQWCFTDSDCHVKVNSCSCSNICANDYYDKAVTCARACQVNEINQTIQICQCSKNKCVQGFLKD